MDELPDEVILVILSFLDVLEITHCQAVSSRFLALARDNNLWKLQCFEDSRAEALRRRQRLLDVHNSPLEELRNAISSLHGGDQIASSAANPTEADRKQRVRALANWEPGYPGESINYYEEYIQRHADVNIDWIELPNQKGTDQREIREATGVGVLSEHGSQKLISPVDDGSVCIWDVHARSTGSPGGNGSLIGQSRPGLLTNGATSELSHALMTETGAVECVSIDGHTQRGHFAVQNTLQEVDLRTLQVTSTKKYPFPITALSTCQPGTPLTVGTNSTVHLHDSRELTTSHDSSTSGTVELIGGSVTSHATLSQPGPLSILNHVESSSIWIAGRFTSLLRYDIRHFPRLLGTIHSGARIASLTSLPHPFVPRSLDLVRNPQATISNHYAARNKSGTTLVAAAEYKGKGSLELHGPPGKESYQNRQTASASKLLSVAKHGGRLVFSDGDGNLRWMERNGSTLVRQYNINSDLPSDPHGGDARSGGLFSSSASEMPGQGDIVQKILPLRAGEGRNSSDRPDIPNEPLLLWSGDGRLGCLSFGTQNPLKAEDDWHDAVEAQAMSVEERAKEDAERQYAMTMRRALERNADEVRGVVILTQLTGR
ncbi:hypothetical protein Q7P37_004117 [Cladosporium fusiforme]